MQCPFCGYVESKVIDSRAANEGASIRRRRECLRCGRRFTTYEVIEKTPFMVVKKDGRREKFDKAKLLNGLLRSCEKRAVALDTIEGLADQVEKELLNDFDKEVNTTIIGETVMRLLKRIDQVAYVRFASVYREFADINTFMRELESLLKTQDKSEGIHVDID